MKKFLFVILSLSMLLSLNSCDWFNSTILGKPSKAEIAKKIRMENARKDSLANLEQEALQLRQQQEAEAAAAAQLEAERNQRYHVLVGCFKVKSNADRMMAKLSSKGFHPIALEFRSGFTCISAQSFSDIHVAYNAMNALMKNSDFCPGDVWVYDSNQQLHR